MAMLILTIVPLLNTGSAVGAGCPMEKKSDAFDVANNLLVSKTTSDWLSHNKAAARELIKTVIECNVKNVLTKLGNLRTKYADCDELSIKQVEEMIDLMRNQSLLDPTNEAVSERRLNDLVMNSLEALYATCLDKFKEELPEVDKEHRWIVSEPNKLGILVDYDLSWNIGHMGRILLRPRPHNKSPLVNYRRANYDEIRRPTSDRARKAWMYFFSEFQDHKLPLVNWNSRTRKWIVTENNVAQLYDHYVTKSCQVFKGSEMNNLMSRVDAFVNRWKVDPRRIFFEKDYILRVMLNWRICKELEKENKRSLIYILTRALDSKLKEELMEYLQIE